MNHCKQCGTQLSDDAVFCPKCGCKVEETCIHPQTATESTAPRKKTNVCSILAIVFGAIGIIPLLNILFLPIAAILAIIGVIIGKSKGTKIASIVVLLLSITVSLLWMVPAITGTPTPPADEPPTFCSHSYVLQESRATCSSGGVATYKCFLCDSIKKEYESALGHNWINNKCERCGATKDLELDPKNNGILAIEKIDWDINSVDGVEPSITCSNQTDKQIAYIYFTLKFYDRMGNPAYCSIRDTHTRRLKVTGPINAGTTDTYYWDPIIYNGSVAAAKPLKIEVEFTDGTRQTIICTGRYWYSKSYYGGALKD